MYNELYLDQNILIIAAAGNSGPSNNVKSYPGSYTSVVSVAAIDSGDNLASFSQVNDQVEIAAPGVGVKSTIPGGQNNQGSYATWSGTKMAVSHIGIDWSCSGRVMPSSCVLPYSISTMI